MGLAGVGYVGAMIASIFTIIAICCLAFGLKFVVCTRISQPEIGGGKLHSGSQTRQLKLKKRKLRRNAKEKTEGAKERRKRLMEFER